MAQALAPAAAVLPGDDFYGYVNGAWTQATEIPADRSNWGAGAMLAEETNARIVKLIEAVALDKQADAGANPEARQVATYYAAYMDEAGIEARGTRPLQPIFRQIAAIKDKKGLAQALGASVRADVDPLNDTNSGCGSRRA
jgi:predicted metalloendopeptidase